MYSVNLMAKIYLKKVKNADIPGILSYYLLEDPGNFILSRRGQKKENVASLLHLRGSSRFVSIQIVNGRSRFQGAIRDVEFPFQRRL